MIVFFAYKGKEQEPLQFFPSWNDLTNAIGDMMKKQDMENSSVNVKDTVYELENEMQKMGKGIFGSENISIKAHLFGSRVTGLAMPGTDIDLFLEVGE